MATQAPISIPPQADPIAEALELLGIARGRYDLTPLDGVRRVVARRLAEAARDIPHFPLVAHIAAQPLIDARAAYDPGEAGKVSVNDMLVSAVAQALIAVPEVNASFTEHGVVRHHHADVAVAVSIPGGLITPIVRDAEVKAAREIAIEVRDLADRARRKRLKPDEYNGGSFCISNLGMYGVSSFGSILNPPHGAILSVGAVEDRVVPVNGAPGVAKMMTVTLTCDHRVIDGATGARWLQAFAALIADAGNLK
ncbi:2-oxo acid dehydrogenase subunit E2 [uncultured Sphingomonas sp.]|uniref:2-oxo acid dehydrogenase subunit E2 n=1 Tax=uncultured Sphingomonas sp. TaxID=158754 RepID=UPI0026033B57|nr:2-oxo acid dehydrogenase subunit E2 [uncultured Sphingomonas sp.]